MQKQLWFKRKTFGRGRTPVTWQGWLVILCYALLLIGGSYYVDTQRYQTPASVYVFMVFVVFITAGLFAICFQKGESPRRQRGRGKN